MADNLITIARYANYIEAELARQMLEDNGIKSVVTGQNASNMFMGVPAIAGPELQVLQSRSEKALKILEAEKEQQHYD